MMMMKTTSTEMNAIRPVELVAIHYNAFCHLFNLFINLLFTRSFIHSFTMHLVIYFIYLSTYRPIKLVKIYVYSIYTVTAARTWNSLSQHVTSLRTLYVCFPRSPQGFPLQTFLPITYHNFCGACAVTVVILGHFNHFLLTSPTSLETLYILNPNSRQC